MITGFKANLKADDGGTGAAPGGVSTAYAGVVSFNLPDLETPTFDATELDQGASDPYERERPAGTIKIGKTQCEIKFTKANYQRLQAQILAGLAGNAYTFVMTTPDDLTTPGTPVTLVGTFKGFVSKVGGPKFTKGEGLMIPFEITVREKPTSYA